MCRHCRYQGTVTAGTIFDKTRMPLRVWLAAAWYVTNPWHRVSALGLQRELRLNSYQTAWTMLHRLRHALTLPRRHHGSAHGLWFYRLLQRAVTTEPLTYRGMVGRSGGSFRKIGGAPWINGRVTARPSSAHDYSTAHDYSIASHRGAQPPARRLKTK